MKKCLFIFLSVAIIALAIPKGEARAINFVQLSNFYLIQSIGLHTFNVANANLSLNQLPLSVQGNYLSGGTLTMTRYCKGQIDTCGQAKAARDAQCLVNKNLCSHYSNDQTGYCAAQENTCLQNSSKMLQQCKDSYLVNNIRCWYMGSATAKACTSPNTQSCSTATGATGTQTAVSCDTTTGQWVWGDCQAKLSLEVTVAPIQPLLTTCVSLGTQTQTLACPAGQTGLITQRRSSDCPGPTWSAWVTVSDTCATAPPGVCTSFTYSDWGACTNGTQTRTATGSSPSGCTGGNPILSQPCVATCQGTQPTCGLGYVGSYTCVNGAWQSNCKVACSQPPPTCASGWSGSYSCMPSGGGYIWMNTCVPPGPQLCYRGVAYHLVTDTTGNTKAYVKCDGQGNIVNGQMCLLNDCGFYQPWNDYGTESAFKVYTDTIYTTTIPSSCNSSFVYTQCQ